MKIARWWFASSIVADAGTTFLGITYGTAVEGNRFHAAFGLAAILIFSGAKLFLLYWSRLMRLWADWLYPTVLALLGTLYWVVSVNNLRIGV